jgi:quinol monooxygenase YgiN
MLVAHVFFPVPPNKREEALNILLARLHSVRAMKGCLRFIPFADPTNEEGVAVLHEWETREDFNAYVTDPGFVELRQALGLLMTGTPVSRRFDATLLEPLN